MGVRATRPRAIPLHRTATKGDGWHGRSVRRIGPIRLLRVPVRSVAPEVAQRYRTRFCPNLSQKIPKNWSGFDLKNAPNEVPIPTYDEVEGEWYVPSVANAVFDETTFSVFWVGLDGDDGICPTYCPGGGHTSDLWQAGTGQQITSMPFNLNGRVVQFIFSDYFAWTELLPAQSIQTLANFNVSPGDEMFISVWVGDFAQSPSLFGHLAIAFVEDITRSEYTYVYNPIATGQIWGYQAEWIMERPFENGALPDLADYNHANMYLPYAQLWLPFGGPGSWISYDQANAEQIFMTGSTGDLLSGAFSVGPGRIYYNWYNHH
ncbi:MAG: G1 family glutamic endopeptidase [Candidatus Sulfotelmatobacter sp.]